MKTIIKLAAACSILLIGVGCQEKNTAGGGASTFAAGDAVKQAKQDTMESLTEEEKERIEEKIFSADKAMEETMQDAMQAAMFDEEVSSIIAPALKEQNARMEQTYAIFDRQIVTAKMRELREKANGASAPGSAP